ncbi:PucR family transcriptional regulator [Lentzea flaviverrucosa]|uniref:Sugar diacid utilization regulator n=1 Tax=Lentzea flaviverrucosa TaxID=200379 RepID=A0A1H9BDF7_9PSEU|nr:helix-turn-helix domain-containing protein [Lentzea flaviverrucosa]RDI31824.1 CdaR family transcriptional regulator [Lentzea flaviverrucosa]SEP86318.1 Sugar diacid utilization regulator [Lentzea flaviverrucosa]
MAAGTGELDGWARAQLSTLYGLFVLSMKMFSGRDPQEILALAATSVPSLGPCTVVATYLMTNGSLELQPAGGPADPFVSELDDPGSGVVLADGTWRWAFPLRGTSGLAGCLVVVARSEPTVDEMFLLKVLGQQTTAALANATLHRDEDAYADGLRRSNDERSEVNAQLTATVTKLRQQQRVHEVLTRVSASGAGEQGIADALNELTALPVAIEDQFGNLRAWAGPGRPDPYPKLPARRREDLLRRAARLTSPLRERDRLVSLVKPHHEVLGVVSLIDPAKTSREYETFTLEYGTVVLASELAHQRSLAEVELRLHRELVDDLVTGTDNDSAYARSGALGHDLRGAHHVVMVQWSGAQTDGALSHALSHAITELGWKALCSRRSGVGVVVVRGRPDGEALFRALAQELGDGTGVVAIGRACAAPDGLPQSFKEASRALRIRRSSRRPSGVASFEQLGLYRILDTGESRAEITSFVWEWLGGLIDYDTKRAADMVRTLSQFLECGGNYDRTATALMIHRSTLRYRLGRMKEITGFDLGDVETRLNVHVATRAWQVLQGRPLEGR